MSNKHIISGLAGLVLVLALVLAAIRWHQAQEDSLFSLASWRHMTHYTGDVCILPTVDQEQLDSHGLVKCLNGVPATGATINAGESYAMWIGCYRDHEHYACIMAGDR